MIDQRTASLQLPLPNPSNTLADDVDRLIDALTMIDALISAKADAGTVSASLALKADARNLLPYRIAPTDAANYLVEDVEIMPTDTYTVGSLLEFKPGATLQLVDMPSIDGILKNVTETMTVSGNLFAYGTLFLRSGVTLRMGFGAVIHVV